MPTVITAPNPNWTPREHIEKPHKPIVFHKLIDVEAEEVRWTWYPYIPAGKLTMLEGDPGQGKSWITCALAADLSAGRALPGATAMPPQKVLMLSAEDGLGDTIRPRIDALQGNMNNIFVSDDFFILDPQGVKDMEELMRATAATIVFMDPIVAYMGAKVDMHRANEVRGLMTALAEAAKRTGTAIVAVRHMRKSGTNGGKGKAIYSGIGSIDFTAAVRSVLQVEETKSGKKYLYHAKHNLTPKGPSLAYNFEGGAFSWAGILSRDEENGNAPAVNTKSRAVAKAEQFLHDMLRDGPVSAATLLEAAAKQGISLNSLNRAKPGLAISRKTPDGWVWELEARAGIDGPAQPKPVDPQMQALIAAAKARLSARSELQ